MIIKKATKKDARRISYLIGKITDTNPNNYTQKQIIAWTKYNTPSQIVKQLNDRIIFCAFENNRLMGTIALKEDLITGFYVSNSKRGLGMGSKLLKHLESFAKENNISKLYLTSTPSALGFYKKKGYSAIQDVLFSIYDVDFPEVEMEKVID